MDWINTNLFSIFCRLEFLLVPGIFGVYRIFLFLWEHFSCETGEFFVFWEPFSSKMDNGTYWEFFFGAHSFSWNFDGKWISFFWRGLFSSEVDDPTSWNCFVWRKSVFEILMGTEMVFILETFFGWYHILGVFFWQFWFGKFWQILGALFWVTPFSVTDESPPSDSPAWWGANVWRKG